MTTKEGDELRATPKELRELLLFLENIDTFELDSWDYYDKIKPEIVKSLIEEVIAMRNL